jgi:hypothetical protein
LAINGVDVRLFCMARDKTRDLQRMNRRSFVKTLSAMGVSATSLKYLSKDALADTTDDPSDEIPVLQFLKTPDSKEEAEQHSGFSDPIGRVPIYEPVPRDEWLRIEAVHNAAEELQKELQSDGIKRVTVGVSSRQNGHHTEKVLQVRHRTLKRGLKEYTPNITIQELEERIPAKVTGSAGKDDYQKEVEDIPVVVRRMETVEQNYESKYRPVPGGCAIDPETSNAGRQGTLGTPVKQPNSSNDAWVTAAHVVARPAGIGRDDSTITADIYQPHENQDTIGTAYSWDWWYPSSYPDPDGEYPADAVVITSDWADDSKFDIACDGSGCSGDYEGWDVKGTVTWDRIKLIEGVLDHTLQGKTTGRNPGKILSTDWPMYEVDVDSEKGDSGGPYFESPMYTDEVYIGGIHHGLGSSIDTAEGTAMEPIENKLDVYVGGSYGT